jgi:hypothetical protein
MTRIAHVVFGVALAATSGCMMDDIEDEPETSSVESAVMILPTGGTWDYGETTTVSGNCNAAISHFEDGAFEVGGITSQSFTVTPHDGTSPFICKSNLNEGFSCPNRLTASFDFRPFLDIQLTVRGVATGLFTDTRHARGKQDLIVDCVGAHCPLIGPNPCGYVANFEVHHM